MSSLSRLECFRILNLPSSASEDDIRQAYRTKALDNHPDRNPGDPAATAKFQRISQAYRVLAGDNNTYRDESDSDEEFGGSDMDFMFMYSRMFEQLRREVMREEALRRERRREVFADLLFDGLFWSSRSDYRQQYSPHQERRRAYVPDPPRGSEASSAKGKATKSTRKQGRKTRTETTDNSYTAFRAKQNRCTSPKQSYQADKKADRPQHNETPKKSKMKQGQAATPGKSSTSTKGKGGHKAEDEGSRQEPGVSSCGSEGCNKVPTTSGVNSTTPNTHNSNSSYQQFQPKKLTKKQQLAQQEKREREAAAIGLEIRRKKEQELKPK